MQFGGIGRAAPDGGRPLFPVLEGRGVARRGEERGEDEEEEEEQEEEEAEEEEEEAKEKKRSIRRMSARRRWESPRREGGAGLSFASPTHSLSTSHPLSPSLSPSLPPPLLPHLGGDDGFELESTPRPERIAEEGSVEERGAILFFPLLLSSLSPLCPTLSLRLRLSSIAFIDLFFRIFSLFPLPSPPPLFCLCLHSVFPTARPRPAQSSPSPVGWLQRRGPRRGKCVSWKPPSSGSRAKEPTIQVKVESTRGWSHPGSRPKSGYSLLFAQGPLQGVGYSGVGGGGSNSSISGDGSIGVPPPRTGRRRGGQRNPPRGRPPSLLAPRWGPEGDLACECRPAAVDTASPP